MFAAMSILMRFQRWLGFENARPFHVFLGVLAISLIFRAILIHYLLPYYSIDENEVVESAIGFVVGDLDPRFYKYGHLTSYVLALVYYAYAAIVSVFSSSYLNMDQVLYDVFFIRYDFYYIARFQQVVFNLVIAIFSFKLADMFFNRRVAWFALALLLIPVQEFHLDYTVRVDDTLAMCFVLTTYFYIRFLQDGKDILLTGLVICLAAAFASKPMPALFSFIVLVIPFLRSEKKGKFIGRVLITFILASLIFNPYFVLKFQEFFKYNYESLTGFQTSSEEMSRYAFGYEFFWIGRYGIPYQVIAFISFIVYSAMTFMRRNEDRWMGWQLMIIPVTYWLGFSQFNTRFYWFITLIPFIAIMIAVAWDQLSRFTDAKVALIGAAAVLFIVANLNVLESNIRIANDVLTKEVAMTRFESKFRQTVQKGARVLLIGNQSRSPYLINRDINKEAQRGQYFMYERMQNEGYKNFFIKAHQYWVRFKDTYTMFTLDQNWYDLYQGSRLEELVYKNLLKYAKQQKIQYIVLTTVRANYVSDWESSPDIRKVIDTHGMEDVYGPNVKMYQVLRF